jgi:hypothetical protein
VGDHNQGQSCMCWRAGRTVHVQPASNYALKLVCVLCVAVHMYSADTQPSSRCERSVRAQPCVKYCNAHALQEFDGQPRVSSFKSQALHCGYLRPSFHMTHTHHPMSLTHCDCGIQLQHPRVTTRPQSKPDVCTVQQSSASEGIQAASCSFQKRKKRSDSFQSLEFQHHCTQTSIAKAAPSSIHPWSSGQLLLNCSTALATPLVNVGQHQST